MHAISRFELQAMLGQIELAISNHNKWSDLLARVLICRLPFDPALASCEAHRNCAFGRWYYHQTSGKLRCHPAFVAMERQHREMHELASALLCASAGGDAVTPEMYDQFTRRMAQFRLELDTLKREVETTLGSLDPLTGANNRIGMLTWLRGRHELVRRSLLACSLAMIDLDHFKQVNDNHGHLIGDAVLAEISRYMIEHIRPYDKLYRYGGEEFLLCLDGTDLNASYVIVDRLRLGVAGTSVPADAIQIDCSVSCGVASLEPDVPVEKAIERADRALYVAKASGRNRTQVWDTSMQ